MEGESKALAGIVESLVVSDAFHPLPKLLAMCPDLGFELRIEQWLDNGSFASC